MKLKSLKKWWLRPDLNRGTYHYEYDLAFKTSYISMAYRGARCMHIPTKHNKALLLATKNPQLASA
jgi:hypothetical protein